MSTKIEAVPGGRMESTDGWLVAGRRALSRALHRGSLEALAAGALAVVLAGTLAAPVRAGTTGDGPNRGAVLAWGNDSEGQTDVPAAAWEGIVAISAGGDFAMALTWDGKVVAWGDDSVGETNVPGWLTNVKAISAGNNFALALESDGSVIGWGDDTFGQIDIPAAAESGVVAISAGSGFAVALKSDGSIVAWGDDQDGATDIPLVNVKLGSRYVRVPLTNLKSVSTSAQVLGLRQDGSVIAWGSNLFAQSDVPSGLSGITAVAAGGAFSMVLHSDGSITGWGDNTLGELNTPCAMWFATGCLARVTGFSSVSAGWAHALALKNGNIYAWGDNSYGQTTLDWSSGLQGGFAAVAAGPNFSLAIWSVPSAPDAPMTVSAVAGNKSATVSWTDGWDNGAPITSHTVTSSPGGKTCTTSGSACTVMGLVNGKTYTFTVTATNGLGTGPASAPTAPVKPHA